jgi:hypothetical protein
MKDHKTTSPAPGADAGLVDLDKYVPTWSRMRVTAKP